MPQLETREPDRAATPPAPPRGRCAGLLLASAALGALLSACSGESPADLLDTARLEEKQSQPAHARQLYEKILARWPESPQAAEARARLQALAVPGAAGSAAAPAN